MLREVLTVTSIGISTLPQRRGTSFVIVAGIACVVGVLVSMLSVAAGQTRMYLSGSSDQRAIILPKDQRSEHGSRLSPGHG